MQEGLRALLLADSGVSTLVGTRVVWGERAQGSDYPAVVLNRISGAPYGAIAGPADLSLSRVQADCYALSLGGAVAVERAVVSCLNGYRGTSGTTEFGSIFLEAARDMPPSEAVGDERPFRISLDFMVHHKES